MNGTNQLTEEQLKDFDRFSELAAEYAAGKITAAEFKTFHVPMGVYEQRQDGTYMVRLRTTGGVIAPRQLSLLTRTARAHGGVLLHLTTRQEIQIHGLSLDRVVSVMRELSAEELSSKGGGGNTIRNMLVSEWSGIGPHETFDTTPYAQELTTRLIAEADSYGMPRKIKMAFSSDENDADYAAINDIGYVARIVDGRRGFRVYIGGGAGAKPTIGWLFTDFLPEEQLYALAKAVKRFFADYGDRKNRARARMRYIFYRLGENETLRIIGDYFRRELEEAPTPLHIRQPENQTSAGSPADTGTADAAYLTWKRRHVTPQRQAGLYSILLPVPNGNIPLSGTQAEILVRLMDFIATLGDDTVRFICAQNIRLRNIPATALPEIHHIIYGNSDKQPVPPVVANIISCTGADTCRIGLRYSKGLAAAIRRELLASPLDLDRLTGVTIHVAGCPNSCGQQLWADLGFAGRTLRGERPYPGYEVFVAAHRHGQPQLATDIGSIGARDVPAFVRRLLADYLSRPEADTGSITAYLEGTGKDVAIKLLEEYKAIPTFTENPLYYTDWNINDLPQN